MIPNADRALLLEASGGDASALQELLRRVEAGEPAPYVAGLLAFRGRRFRIDRRAYITDPEATRLIDVVLAEGDAWNEARRRPPSVLEFGVGAGTLALSVLLERPTWQVVGLDIDRDALTLAAENARIHGVELPLLASDFLDAWPLDWAAPDLLFADPPWGGEDDLYDAARDADYYRQMPACSAFPSGGRSGIHDELIRRLCRARWPTLLLLHYGILPLSVIEQSAAPLASWRVEEVGQGQRVLIGRAIDV